ncbi:acyl carrier protein [Paenibacillus sp. FSL R7-0337]|uniref:acyl carrier protein n=1 Tax=Paenibacillus sp. FSL R7-0337 TaxID=1926588 RepID=UPI00096FD354|nr:acyl carrier protein [Paenibacillus sp. FSL R7-0337]OMF98429.1 acyl carrier protein [Paenibacillus sp. FSL R7-0337]
MHEKIRGFIERHLVTMDEEVELKDDDNIFLLGYVNSLFAMTLIQYLESEFQVVIETEDMEIENFNCVTNIVGLINRKIAV